jgi:hypothetical protein
MIKREKGLPSHGTLPLPSHPDSAPYKRGYIPKQGSLFNRGSLILLAVIAYIYFSFSPPLGGALDIIFAHKRPDSRATQLGPDDFDWYAVSGVFLFAYCNPNLCSLRSYVIFQYTMGCHLVSRSIYSPTRLRKGFISHLL